MPRPARARRSRSPPTSSRPSTTRCGFRRRSCTDEFPVRMLRDVAVVARWQERRLQRARASLCQAAARRAAARSHDDDGSNSSRRSRATATRSSTPPGATPSCGRVRVVRPDGIGRPRRRHDARALRRAVVLAGRPAIVYRAAGRRPDARASSSANDAGVFVVPVAGGDPLLVRDSGSEPEFDHTGTRIYFRERRATSKYTLLSVGVPAGRPSFPGATKSSTSAATTRPSSCSRPTASGSRSRSATRLMSRRSRTPAVRSTSVRRRRPIPVQRVSRDAGFYLHWSADSRRVYWTLGPELYTRDVAETFAFARRRRRRKPDEPEAKGIAIGFDARQRHACGLARAGRRPHHHHGRPEAGRSRDARCDRERDRPVEPTASPRSGRRLCYRAGRRARIDVRGKTIMPGIVDVHGHVSSESSGLLAQSSWPLAANLAFGVTTSHDPSNDSETVFTNARDDSQRRQARAAVLLHRHRPLRRRAADQGGRSRATKTPSRTCGGRRPSARSPSRATTSSAATRAR